MNQYSLHIPDEVERQLRKCRPPIRQSIRKRLQDIVESVAARRASRRRAAAVQGPPLRFYVYEGYRISYQVNPVTRSVIVLQLQPESI